MSVNIEMPKLSDTMTEGTLIKWHKQVGDSVEIGDILAEIETDKATMEMEAFDDGTITSIFIEEGGKAPIGSVLAVLDGPTTAAAPQQAAAHAVPAAVETPAPPPAAVATPVAAPLATPAAAPLATPAESAPAPAAVGGRIFASPLARKVATELGVDLATVNGTGPANRITKSDVEAASARPAATPATALSSEANAAAALSASIKSKTISSTGSTTPATTAPATTAPAAAPTPVVQATPAPQAIMPIMKEGDETIELSTMRKVIASRLLTSKTTIPHFYLHVEADAAPLMTLRKQVNEQAESTHGNKYSVNDFILKAVISAAQTVPAINASFAGDHIVKFKNIGLCIAVAVDDGLVTPVIKDAASKSLLQISRTVKDFAARAKENKLRPDEYDGGTITVSNLGAWGIESFDAIVNPPQASILSVGAALEKPVVKNGQVVPGLRMNLGLSCDHRVVDGAVGAAFLSEVKKLVENPALMLL